MMEVLIYIMLIGLWILVIALVGFYSTEIISYPDFMSHNMKDVFMGFVFGGIVIFAISTMALLTISLLEDVQKVGGLPK